MDEKYTWKEIVTPIYPKLIPIKSIFYNEFFNPTKEKNFMGNYWIIFILPNFKFIDPFYGETENGGEDYEMRLDLEMMLSGNKIKTIKDFENKKFDYDYINEDAFGHFSSIGLQVSYCKFGIIHNGTIDFKMEYILTNLGIGYDNMTGSIKEHSTLRGIIETKLEIKTLLKITPKNETFELKDYYFNMDVYKLKSEDNAKGLNWGYIGSELFELELL
jgi:hypothetical protein